MPVAGRDHRGIGLDVAEALDRQAEQRRHELRKGGLVPLAVRLRTDQQAHGPVGLEADLGAFVRRAAGGLEKAGDADPAQPAGGARCLPSCRKADKVGGVQRRVDVLGEAAAIDGGRHGRAPRKGVGEVAAAELDPVLPQAEGGGIDQPLEQVVCLRLAGAPVGVGRHRVGVGAADMHVHGVDRVAAAHGVARRDRRGAGPAARHRRAEIGDGVDAECQEAALCVERQRRGREVVAAMRGANEVFGVVRLPADWSAEMPRGPQRQHVFRVDRVLDPEPAADIRRLHPHLRARDAKHGVGQRVADAVDLRAGEQQMEPGGRIESGQRAAMLECRDDEPVVDELEADAVGSRRHRRLDRSAIALLEGERTVAGDVRPEAGRAGLERIDRLRHRGQPGIVDLHQLGRVAGGRLGLGHDKRHGLADVAHRVGSQREARRDQHRLGGRDAHLAGDRPEVAEIVGGEGADHRRRTARRRQVEAFDRRMGIGRADDVEVELARAGDIREVEPPPGEEARVFETAERTADHVIAASSAVEWMMRSTMP